MIQRRILLFSLACISLLVASAILPLRLVLAAPHALTADEVMATVNELRRSQGLEPYSIEAVISAYAQEHSEYQARIDTSTHLHSDGQVSLAHGYVENVAGGDNGYLTADAIVYEIWNDPVHMRTMVGYESGAAGVGVASNDVTTFVTLNVRPGDSVAEPTQPGGTSSSGPANTPIPLVPLITATMRPDGAIIHVVGYGQSLWAIAMAYGVTSARIRELNSMAPNDSAIWAGQWLLIVPAGLVTPTPPIAVPSIEPRLTDAEPAEAAALTASDLSPTVTRSATRTATATHEATRTPLQTPTATPAMPALPDSGLAAQNKIDPVMAGLIGLAALGFLLFVFSSVKN